MDGQIAAMLAGGRPGDPGWGTEPPDRHGTLTTELGGLVSTGRLASVPGSYEMFYRAMAAAVRGTGRCRFPGAGARRHRRDRVRDDEQQGGAGRRVLTAPGSYRVTCRPANAAIRS